MPAPSRSSGGDGLAREIRQLTAELAKARQATQRQTATAVRSSGGGGALGGGLALAGRLGVAGAALAGLGGIGAAVGSVASAGIAAGTGFGTGLNAGAGVRAAGRASLDAIAAIPVVGEVLGAGRSSRIADRTQSRVLQITEGIARAGGSVSQDTRQRLTEVFAEQEKRVEREREQVSDAVNSQLGDITEGTALGELVDIVREIRDLLPGGGAA